MSGTICDALMSKTPGELTFPITQRTDRAGPPSPATEEVGSAVRYAFHEFKLVVEPGGAIGLAALLAGKIDGQRQGRRRRLVRRPMSMPISFARLIAGVTLQVNRARRSSSLSATIEATILPRTPEHVGQLACRFSDAFSRPKSGNGRRQRTPLPQDFAANKCADRRMLR